MSYVETPTRTFASSSLAIGKYLRVVMTAGVLAIAGADVAELGVTEYPVLSGDTTGTVRLRTAQGTRKVVANGAITAGSNTFAAASGKVSATGTVFTGIALEAATADGDVIEVLDGVASAFNRPVSVNTANLTLTAADSGKVITNTGAAGAITVALPVATLGLTFTFYVNAAQELRIDPNGTETIALPSTGAQSAAGKYISADAVGEFVTIVCAQAGKWATTGFLGTWTAEA